MSCSRVGCKNERVLYSPFCEACKAQLESAPKSKGVEIECLVCHLGSEHGPTTNIGDLLVMAIGTGVALAGNTSAWTRTVALTCGAHRKALAATVTEVSLTLAQEIRR